MWKFQDCPLAFTTQKKVLSSSSKNKRICLEKQMKKFIEEIIKRSASSLVCFWSLIPSLDIDARLFNWNEMIAWNHSLIPLPPAIESFAGNWNYLDRQHKPGDLFSPSKMKQIECTFKLEVSYWTFLITMLMIIITIIETVSSQIFPLLFRAHINNLSSNIKADSLRELNICNNLKKCSISSTMIHYESNFRGPSFLEEV